MRMIEKIYDNEMLQGHEIKSQDYKEALNKVCRLEDEILSTFPDCKELFDQYQSAEIDLMQIDMCNKFVKGFKLGGQIVMEILMSSDNN